MAMAELKPWRELPVGGTVAPASAPPVRTGGWRTGTRPTVDLSRCVNCLLCWLYCPDSAVRLDGTTFVGFELEHCKGCELCAEVCPVDAIEMVADDDD
jgi:2-oxoacid:acceptor oxidoreductase delta subunit (pyruvate/2-ketoisovalerate family)